MILSSIINDILQQVTKIDLRARISRNDRHLIIVALMKDEAVKDEMTGPGRNGSRLIDAISWVTEPKLSTVNTQTIFVKKS